MNDFSKNKTIFTLEPTSNVTQHSQQQRQQQQQQQQQPIFSRNQPEPSASSSAVRGSRNAWQSNNNSNSYSSQRTTGKGDLKSMYQLTCEPDLSSIEVPPGNKDARRVTESLSSQEKNAAASEQIVHVEEFENEEDALSTIMESSEPNTPTTTTLNAQLTPQKPTTVSSSNHQRHNTLQQPIEPIAVSYTIQDRGSIDNAMAQGLPIIKPDISNFVGGARYVDVNSSREVTGMEFEVQKPAPKEELLKKFVQQESVEIIGDFLQRTSIDSTLLSAPHPDKSHQGSVTKSLESTNPVAQPKSSDYLLRGSKSDVSYDLTSVSSWETQQGNEDMRNSPLIGNLKGTMTSSSISALSESKSTIDSHRILSVESSSSSAISGNNDPVHQPITSSSVEISKTNQLHGRYPISKSYAADANQSHHGYYGGHGTNERMSRSLSFPKNSTASATAPFIQNVSVNSDRKATSTDTTSFNETDERQIKKAGGVFNKTTPSSKQEGQERSIKREDFFNKVSYEHWPFSRKTSGDHVEQLNVLKNFRNSESGDSSMPVITSWLEKDTNGKTRLSLEEREIRLQKVYINVIFIYF